MRNPFPAAAHAYTRLAPRERLLVQIAAGVTALIIAYLVVGSFHSAQAALRTRIAAKERQLEQIQELRRAYLQVKSQTERLTADYAERPQNFSVFSYLETAGTKTVTREKILAMSPSSKTVGDEFVEESVELRISGVTLPQMVGLLHQVENAPVPLRVSRLQMKKRFNEPYNFDVTMAVSTITRAT
ncbi:MAG: ral secretion pathway protein [Candidatus Binatota bacterium]|jgi:hypothetical protein|nr:ral secretion pathway protein [Candidatus Binatota bacterium]